MFTIANTMNNIYTTWICHKRIDTCNTLNIELSNVNRVLDIHDARTNCCICKDIAVVIPVSITIIIVIIVTGLLLLFVMVLIVTLHYILVFCITFMIILISTIFSLHTHCNAKHHHFMGSITPLTIVIFVNVFVIRINW